jgi:hypothetical protein
MPFILLNMKTLIILLTIIPHGKAHHLTQADIQRVQSYRQTSLNYAMQHNTVIRNTDIGDNILVLAGKGGCK